MDLVNIGKTAEGRDYPVLVSRGAYPADSKAAGNNLSEKKLIVAASRMHSGETPGSFVLEGFINKYCSTDEKMKQLRENTVLLVLPLTNLDGVESGRYGKDSPPEDFNRAWYTQSTRPELRSFLNLLEELLKIYLPGFYVDFHAPSPGGLSFIVPPGVSGNINKQKLNEFISLYEKLCGQYGVCRAADLDPSFPNWGKDNYRLMSLHMLAESYGFQGVAAENAYQTDCYGNYLEPDDWRVMGEHFMEAIRQIYFDNNENPGEPEAACNGWEICCQPEKAETEEAPGEFRLKSGGGGKIIFSDYRKIYPGEKGSYNLVCRGSADIAFFAYYNDGNKTAFKGRVYCTKLDDESLQIPFSLLEKNGYTHYRIVFRINSITGELNIRKES